LFLPTTILKNRVGLKESALYFVIAVGLNEAGILIVPCSDWKAIVLLLMMPLPEQLMTIL
jgi:hypothetical protein